jgi:hypothetical protein
MTIKTQARAPGSMLLSEASGARSRANLLIAASVAILVGQVLGVEKANTGTIAVGTPVLTGAGNGTLTKAAPAFSATAQEGTYTVRAVEKTTDSGEFAVVRPDGTVDGYAVVGTAYDGQIKFTIADGSTDFDQTSSWAVPVTIGDPAAVGSYKPLDVAATDGTQNAVAIALYPLGATDTYRQIAGLVRDCEVIGGELEWPSGIDANAKAAAIAQLAAQGIIVR